MDPGFFAVGGTIQHPGRNLPAVLDGDVKGGLHVVANDTERDAIPAPMRSAGMIARYPDGREYSLGVDLLTWTLVSLASRCGHNTLALQGNVAMFHVTTSVPAEAEIFLQPRDRSTYFGEARIANRTTTGFDVVSTNSNDRSVISWRVDMP